MKDLAVGAFSAAMFFLSLALTIGLVKGGFAILDFVVNFGH